MPEIDWDVLKPAIKKRKCVLFLGPDAYPFDENQTVEQAMWAKTTEDTSLVRKFYADDGLVLFQKPAKRGRFIESMELFYKNETTDWSLTKLQLQKLIHIPFLAIVNLTFDHLLSKNFDDADLNYNKLHYIFRPSLTEKIIQALPLEGDKPLILNLLGSIHSSDNLVLAHNDLFDFLKTLFTDKDQWLQELLHEADCFLFVGIPFEKWYMQLLLQKLSKYTKSSDEAERYALPEQKEVKMTDLYEHELKIQFVDATQQTVIDTLYAYCEDQNILNKPNTDVKRYKNADFIPIYSLLLRGSLLNAIQSFMTWANNSATADNNLKDGATLLTARYNTMEADKNTTDAKDYKIERNKIIKALLNYLDDNDQ